MEYLLIEPIYEQDDFGVSKYSIASTSNPLVGHIDYAFSPAL